MTLVKNWTDLNTWQKAHELVTEIYKITKLFPKDELYALISQRRAAVSIAANIVEGFHRKSKKDRVNFYMIALTSLEEVKYYIFLSKDLHYIGLNKARELYSLCNEVGKLLRRWIQTQK